MSQSNVMHWGMLSFNQQGKHHQIYYPSETQITKTWAGMTEQERMYFDSQPGIRGQSGFFIFQYIYKYNCMYETAKRAYELGRITYEYYQYLITPQTM